MGTGEDCGGVRSIWRPRADKQVWVELSGTAKEDEILRENVKRLDDQTRPRLSKDKIRNPIRLKKVDCDLPRGRSNYYIMSLVTHRSNHVLKEVDMGWMPCQKQVPHARCLRIPAAALAKRSREGRSTFVNRPKFVCCPPNLRLNSRGP